MNLEKMSKQEVFDYVAKHLLTQNKRAEDKKGNCQYLTSDNLMCAAGCLISPKDYLDIIEGHSWATALQNLPDKYHAHQYLISALQNIHDNINIEDWETALRDLAKRYNLIWSLT